MLAGTLLVGVRRLPCSSRRLEMLEALRPETENGGYPLIVHFSPHVALSRCCGGATEPRYCFLQPPQSREAVAHLIQADRNAVVIHLSIGIAFFLLDRGTLVPIARRRELFHSRKAKTDLVQAAAHALMVHAPLQIAFCRFLRGALEISLRTVVPSQTRKTSTRVMQGVAQALRVDSPLRVALFLRFERAREPRNGVLVLFHLHQARAYLVQA